jgi:hypothetical protein
MKSAPIESKLVGRRVITGTTNINITVRLEDKGGYVKDAVFFEMVGEFGHGRSITMQLNLFKLRRLAVALGHAAKNRTTSYKEFTDSNNIKKQLSLNFDDGMKCWLNMTSSDGGKAGRECGYYDLVALESTLNTLCDHCEGELYEMQKGKNI